MVEILLYSFTYSLHDSNAKNGSLWEKLAENKHLRIRVDRQVASVVFNRTSPTAPSSMCHEYSGITAKADSDLLLEPESPSFSFFQKCYLWQRMLFSQLRVKLVRTVATFLDALA